MKKTPLQEVKERFGSKEALVKGVASMIERPAGETEADSISRLTSVPNSKLLHLHHQAKWMALTWAPPVLLRPARRRRRRAPAKQPRPACLQIP